MSSGKWRPFCLGLNVLSSRFRLGRSAAYWAGAVSELIDSNTVEPCESVCRQDLWMLRMIQEEAGQTFSWLIISWDDESSSAVAFYAIWLN